MGMHRKNQRLAILSVVLLAATAPPAASKTYESKAVVQVHPVNELALDAIPGQPAPQPNRSYLLNELQIIKAERTLDESTGGTQA